VKIILVSNYPKDAQESMLRFARCLHEGLRDKGIDSDLIAPEAIWAKSCAHTYSGKAKWLGYIDKFVLFPMRLKKLIRQEAKKNNGEFPVIHVCDHSNALLCPGIKRTGAPLVVTCHDLIAARSVADKTGEYNFGWSGRIFQRGILRGLGFADRIPCDSQATQIDVKRLVKGADDPAKTKVVWLGLSYVYQVLDEAETRRRLETLGNPKLFEKPFLLHVGSNQPRKNRDGILKVLARAVASGWDGQAVFAGDTVPQEYLDLARELKVEDRLIQVIKPSNELLEALFNQAFVLLFPSRSEGFGWPPLEAQSSGCPVLSSNAGSLPEVIGDSAPMHDAEDLDAYVRDLLALRDEDNRKKWVAKSLENAGRFSVNRMVENYLSVYREAAAK